MTNNNKILTVSYGTFSCTLEGFDDSFETMKAIAEYFRDLAADDRYFGAEPPQPDADMLARIAEREVSRRVEAQEQDGRILLKAHEDVVPQAGAAMAAAVTSATEPTDAEPTHADAEASAPDAVDDTASDLSDGSADAPEDHTDVVAEEEVSDPEPTSDEAPAPEDASPDAAVASEADVNEQLTSEEKAPVEDDVVALDTAEPIEDTAEPVEEEPSAPDHAATSGPLDDAPDAAAAFFADSPSLEEVEPEAEADLEEGAEFAAFDTPAPFVDAVEAQTATSENIAAKLQRIRDVVSQRDEAPHDAEEVAAEDDPAIEIEDEPMDVQAHHDDTAAEDDATELSEAAQEAVLEIEDALDLDDQIAAQAAEESEEDDDLAAVLNRIDEDASEADVRLFDTTLEAASDEIDENLFDEIVEDMAIMPDTTETDPVSADDAGDEADEEIAPVKGRVLKVDRADLEAALESGDLEEFEAEPAVSLSEADEEELQRELDAVAADAAASEAPAAADSHGLPPIDADAAEDVSRLMAEADHQMEEPEGATRRSAFAHLRAAVAARFADKTMQKEEPEEETTKPYRSDLAQVVKPRRPISSGSRTERPAEPQPTPLKLVAEHRIDAELQAGGDPVMPRRVAATLEDDLEFAQDTGFAEFAEEMGATKLPEVLEAAASYLSFVEGHEQFSRPQLMTRVRQADCGEFSREDGLRSFGQLLRAGKIEKIKGGRFTASDAIGFKPDERAAG